MADSANTKGFAGLSSLVSRVDGGESNTGRGGNAPTQPAAASRPRATGAQSETVGPGEVVAVGSQSSSRIPPAVKWFGGIVVVIVIGWAINRQDDQGANSSGSAS